MNKNEHICSICERNTAHEFISKIGLFQDKIHELLQCENCKTIAFNPMPSQNDLENFYSGNYFNFEKIKLEAKGKFIAKKLNKISHTGNFLEIGCATGFIMNGVQLNSNWKVYGTEFGKDAVDYARNVLNLNVFQGELKNANFESNFFDYIYLNNILEHVLNPLELLQECYRILNKNGTFFISVPNGFADSIEFIRYFKKYNDPPLSYNGHIFFFPKESILNLFKKVGFKVTKAQSYGLKKGLKNSGVYPNKKLKPGVLALPMRKIINSSSEVLIQSEKKRSSFYHQFQLRKKELTRFPGLLKFCLDFQFYLKKDKIFTYDK